MLFIFSTPVLIRHLWQLNIVAFLHWCLICTVLLVKTIIFQNLTQNSASSEMFLTKTYASSLDCRLQVTAPGFLFSAGLISYAPFAYGRRH